MSELFRRPRRAWTADDLRAIDAELGAVVGPPADREAVERDFGQLVRGSALAVLSPRSAEDVERIVRFAEARGLGLTARGRGMSQGGQSIPASGVSLDMSRLTDIGDLDPATRTVRCGAGASWRSVVTASAPAGLLPKVVPLNLDLTVGGLLSVAGIGATSHRFGAAVACVAELDVVTGRGTRVRCSLAEEGAVFQAALGGLGRAALIVGARVELRPFLPRVRTFYLLFDDVESWVAAHRALIRSGRGDYLEGFCTPCVQGMRAGPRGRAPFAQWFYGLHVTAEHAAGAAPEPGPYLEGLGAYRLVYVEDGETVPFAARYDPRFAAMRRSGAWNKPHPWVEALLPGDRTAAIFSSILELYPVFLGDGPRLLFLNRTGAPPYLRMPDTPEITCCAMLPVAIPAHLLPDALDLFRAIHRRIVDQGGKRFLSGWITMMGTDELTQHFGEVAPAWEAAKRSLDPTGVLDSPITFGPKPA